MGTERLLHGLDRGRRSGLRSIRALSASVFFFALLVLVLLGAAEARAVERQANLVLFDTSQGQTLSYYSGLADALRLQGLEVRETGSDLGQLDTAAVLIVSAVGANQAGVAHSGSQRAAIAEFIHRGGGILLLADHSGYGAGVNPIANECGMILDGDVNLDVGGISLVSHAITTGVSSVFFNGATRITGGNPILKSSSGDVLGAWNLAGASKSVVFADTNWISGGRPSDSSLRLATNSVAWLADPRNGGTVPYDGPSPGANGNPTMKPAIVLIGGLDEDYGESGYQASGALWHDVYRYLDDRNYDVYVVPSQKGASAPSVIDSTAGYTGENARRVQNYLDGQHVVNREVIVIGHSMGGLIARKWLGSELWRNSGLTPRGLVQLGTPNAGSPLASLKLLWPTSWFTKSIKELDGLGRSIGHFNDVYPDPGVPVLKLGGNFFFHSSREEIKNENPWNVLAYVAKENIDSALRLAFWGVENDGAVSVDSLMGLPVAQATETYPLIHSEAKGLSPFKSGGFIVPARGKADEDSVLRRIAQFCDDVAFERVNIVLHRFSAQSPLPKTVIAASPAFAQGDAFKTALDRRLTVSDAVTSSVDFSVEGTSAVITVSSMQDDTRFLVRDSAGVVVMASEASSDPVSVPLLTQQGGRHTFEAGSDSDAAQVDVSVRDSGLTSLVVSTQKSGVGGGKALVNAYLSQGPSKLTGDYSAAVDDDERVGMADDGTGADDTAQDGIYSAWVDLPESGMSAEVSVEATSSTGVHRTGFGLVEVVEQRVVISGRPLLRAEVTPSGKVRRLIVDLPVHASASASVHMAASLQDSSGTIAQSVTDASCAESSERTLSVTIGADALDGLSNEVTSLLASVRLYDSTDGGLTAVGSDSSNSIGLSRGDLTLAECRIHAFGGSTNATPVVLAGSASCTSETVSGVEVSLDGGREWVCVPPPTSGWASQESTWACSFTLVEGEYGAMVRLRGGAGLIDGAHDSLVFRVDRTPPSTSVGPLPLGWVQHDVPVILTASDSLGSAITRYSLGGGVFDYESTVTVSSEGVNRLRYWSVDDAGNVEASRECEILIDKTPPVTGCLAAPSYVGRATIPLSATDGALSGVAATMWSLDGETWRTGTMVEIQMPGTYMLRLKSTDNAGNTEAVKSVPVTVVPFPCTLRYAPAIGGVVEGRLEQTVQWGGTGTSVKAVPSLGYRFIAWSDGRVDNPRTDAAVESDVRVTASFAKVISTASIARIPSKSTVSYTRKRGVAKYRLSATIRGWMGTSARRVVYLQTSRDGKRWRSAYKLTTSATGRASKTFRVKKRQALYYRWYVPAKTEFNLKTYSSKIKVKVR